VSELIEVTRTGRSPVRYTAGDEPRRFSNSELATWKWCKRSWMLRHYRELGLLREDPVSAAGLGTLVHLGLETWYAAPAGQRDAEACLEAVRERVKADILLFEERPEKVVKINKQGKLAVTMLEGYFEWLEETGADSELEIISAEESVDLPVPGLPGVRLLGKLDVRVKRHIDGARLFVDHKTVQSIDQTASMAYMQPQFRHYHLLEYLKFLDDQAKGLTETYERTDGVIVNMLRKVGRTAAAKPPFYGREEVHHNVTVMRNHWTQVVGIILEILEAREALDNGADHHEVCPPSPSRDCEWRCIFRPICPMFDDGGDPEAVIRFSYTQTDPLARYGESDEED
jgi:hypothetical protein